MNLWRFYAASSTDGEYTYGHSFCAPTEADAKRVCARNSWRYDGEIQEEVEIADEDLAMFEKAITQPEIH